MNLKEPEMDSFDMENTADKASNPNIETENVLKNEYSAGFFANIETVKLENGLNKEIVKKISNLRNEPDWLLNWRLQAFKMWQSMKEPHWASFDYPPIDYQKITYFSSPKKPKDSKIDPELEKMFEKLGVPLEERNALAGVATDVVVDSTSIATTYAKELEKQGIIFCSIGEAVQKYPEVVKKYLGRVVPQNDNFFASLNAAVFSDGTFVYIPKNIKCPMELASYFRINEARVGQFERTLIVVEDGGEVSYLEGCTAPARTEHQLHAAVVELVALNDAKIKYSTVQNWFPGDKKGGGIYNFVTKRGICEGKNSSIAWTQIETGASHTWKYPSCILKGENSVGEFYSIAATNGSQNADTGTKMIHLGSNTRSKIISKTISAGQSLNTYRGLVKIEKDAKNCRNYTNCDSLIISKTAQAHTFPKINVKNNSAIVEHEASTGKVSRMQLEYIMSRGIDEEEAVALVVSGFSREILQHLPLEFAIEARKLLEISFENSVG